MTPRERRELYPHGWARHEIARRGGVTGLYDVWRFGRVVAARYRTKRLAERHAAALDQMESDDALPLDHDVAHAWADGACLAGDYQLATRLLERAQRDGRLGAAASLRTANRLLNLRERAAS